MVVDDGVCKPDCGENGEVCCAGNKCQNGLECAGGKCKPDCGQDGEVCCAGNKCRNGLECAGGKCKPDCGENGEKPCASLGKCGKWLSKTKISSKPFMEITIKDRFW